MKEKGRSIKKISRRQRNKEERDGRLKVHCDNYKIKKMNDDDDDVEAGKGCQRRK